MPYDTDLEKRIDLVIEGYGPFLKKKMFGGIGYMFKGNMAFGIHRQSLIVRTTLEKAHELLVNGSASVFDMTGRAMPGWLLIPSNRLKDEKILREWLDMSIEFVKTLPEK